MQHYDFSLAVGAVREIHALSRYVYYSEGSAAVGGATIALRKRSGSDAILLRPGQAFELPDSEAVDGWIISNYEGAATITGRLFIGAGKFTDNRISGAVEVLGTVSVDGFVEVIDGGRSRTIKNAAFMGMGFAPTVAGQCAWVQLYNPPASGRLCVVQGITTSSATAGEIGVRQTLLGVVLPTLAGTPYSKLIGGAASVMQMRTGSGIAAVGASLFPLLVGGAFKFAEPIVIRPGYGVYVDHGVIGAALAVSFELLEDAL